MPFQKWKDAKVHLDMQVLQGLGKVKVICYNLQNKRSNCVHLVTRIKCTWNLHTFLADILTNTSAA